MRRKLERTRRRRRRGGGKTSRRQSAWEEKRGGEGRLWLSALEVFNCLHWRPPHQTLHLTHIPLAKKWWYLEKKRLKKKTTQINSCRRKWFYSAHNKCPCHLETSQIASHRFVAPKKAQNAHGGVYDCRPSLKIQSCLCSAMKNHSAPPSLSQQCVQIAEDNTKRSLDARIPPQHGRLTRMGLLLQALDITPLKRICYLFLCSYSVHTQSIKSGCAFFFKPNGHHGCVMPLCVSAFVRQLNGFFNLCQEWVSAASSYTKHHSNISIIHKLGPPQCMCVCTYISSCLFLAVFSLSYIAVSVLLAA